MESLEGYIPLDRRRAMAGGEELPDRLTGAALLVDISGFTPLTEALVRQYGSRRGADELTRQLNRVYDTLITAVHRYGGSVVSFAGDALICWFDGDDGEQATACGLAMQALLAHLDSSAAPLAAELPAPLAIKAGVATGPVRRFLVGDPQIRLIDVLAGATIDRVGEAEKRARKGEVMVDAEALRRLGQRVSPAAWPSAPDDTEAGVAPERRFAVVADLTPAVDAKNLFDTVPSPPEPIPLTDRQLRPWLLPPVYERLKSGRERYLAELRPAVALFLSFEGIDYDRDDRAGQNLDAFIRWVQNVLAGYEGHLIELTIGDKGSYIYGAFGAPLSYGDDAARAVAAALQLRAPPPTLQNITGIKIGLSQGQMRAGPYGGAARRTYGVQGSEVNAAARLMEQAEPGQVLISKRVAVAASRNFEFEYLKSLPVKGFQEPIPTYRILNRRRPSSDRLASLLTRQNVLEQLEQILETTAGGRAQILRLEGVAGVGQSHLAADVRELAVSRGFQIARGICRAESQRPYGPWRQIFRTWLEVVDEPPHRQEIEGWTARQAAQIETILKDINPDWLPLLPLLNPLLDLEIPDTPTTAEFEPTLRQGILLALAMEMIQAWEDDQPSLILIEDAHWLDKASQELTLAVARSLTAQPILLALVHRPAGRPDEALLAELNRLPGYCSLNLHGQPRPPASAEPPAEIRPRLPNAAKSRSHTIGRKAERSTLSGLLRALVDNNRGGIVILEGEAGIGKSQLIAELVKQAHKRGVTTLIGAGDAIEKSTPYYAWRSVFQQLFDLDARPGADMLHQRARTLSLLPPNPELLRLVPLLNAVLPLKLQENEVTRQMSGQVRADNVHELLTRLLQAAAGRSPLLLILEDAHWLDSASWALTRVVSQRVQPILLVIVTRPMPEPVPAEYAQLRQMPALQRLCLEPLSSDEALSLVCQRLGVTHLPEPVVTLIRAKAEGHPFFSEEMAYALRDSGMIRIIEGECRLASDSGDFNAITVPDTIEDVITSRIDRLAPPHQLLLKIASVIGQMFPVNVLLAVHPVESDRPRLPTYLTRLEQLDITMLKTPEPDLAYIFKHAITQEVAYNLLLFDQRRELHRSVAEWFEQTYSRDLSSLYPLLAHHWSRAVYGRQTEPSTVGKALDYLEKAAEKALQSYANREAVQFLSEAIDLAEGRHATDGIDAEHSAPASDGSLHLRRSRWERQLGQAQLRLGHLLQSRRHLERALTLAGWPIPGATLPLIIGLLGQLLRQVRHRLWPAGTVKTEPTRRSILLEAARAYERLGETFYWSNQTLPAIYAVLQTLNLAEQAGPSPELARAYANACLAADFISLRRLAELYSRRAREVAQSLNDEAALAWVLELTGLNAIGSGQWSAAQERLVQAATISNRLKNQRRWEECSTALGDLYHFQGRFADEANLWSDIHASARRRGDSQAQAWGLAGQLRYLIIVGQAQSDRAKAALEDLANLLKGNIGSADEINSYGVLALTHLHRNEIDRALPAAGRAAGLIAASSTTGYGIIHGYGNVAEFYLTLWEAGQRPVRSDSGDEVEPLRSKADQACRALRRFARIFPIGRPRAWLWQGLYHWLDGKPGKARQNWQRCLGEAQRLAMPHEQGLAHYELGRHFATDDAARRRHLRQAAHIFERIQAAHDLARTGRLLPAAQSDDSGPA